jgi:hypothetical protein
MKPTTEMIEGPQALRRFEDTMKSLFTTRKSDVLEERPKQQAHKPPKKARKPKA